MRLLHIFHHVILISDHFFQIPIPIPIHILIAQHVFRTEERRSVHAARHARHCEAQAWLDAVKKLYWERPGRSRYSTPYSTEKKYSA